MPSAAIQDAHDIKLQLANQRLPLAERCRLCELLLTLYPSRRNRQAVNLFIRKYPCGKERGVVYEMKMRMFADKIAAHREKIMANRKAKEIAKRTGTPVGTVAIAPGNDGHEYYVDKDGIVLGQAPDKDVSDGTNQS
jgi:hypothetical protein